MRQTVSTEEFVESVLLDGRYLREFTLDPVGVSNRLGLSLSERDARAIASSRRLVLMRDGVRRMSRRHAETIIARSQGAPVVPGADLGISAVIVIGSIAVVAIIVVCNMVAVRSSVIDESEMAALKL